ILSDENEIEVWELTHADKFDETEKRITWSFESPSFTWSNTIGEHELKRLQGLELEYDQITGTADVTIEYRPDSHPCWLLWRTHTVCSARDSSEDPNTDDYPAEQFLPGHQGPIALPAPK